MISNKRLLRSYIRDAVVRHQCTSLQYSIGVQTDFRKGHETSSEGPSGALLSIPDNMNPVTKGPNAVG